MNKWYIERMKYIFISADGPIYVMLVPDNIVDDKESRSWNF